MAKRTQRRDRRRLRAYKFLNIVLRKSLGLYVCRSYRVRTRNYAVVRSLSSPYLILPNHMSFWDPFFLGALVPEPIYYVTSDANFRSRMLNFLLGLVGAIPKTKVLSDYETIRNILRVKKSGGIIGVYPEGRRTWDGTTLPLYYSMAKLIKLLKIPVVTVVQRGAFLSLPRWAAGKRTGEIELNFKLSFDSADAEKLDADEIFDRLCADLAYNEYEFQEGKQIRFRGRRRAEKIEQVLYACPHCLKFGTLFSRDDRLRCAGCGYEVAYDEFGFLRPGADQPEYHRTVHSWNVWQSEHLIGYLKRSMADGGEAWDHRHRPLLRKGRITLSTGYRSQPLKRHPPGVLSLHSDGLLYTARDGGIRLFPFGEIGGANVQNNERLEFYHDHTLFSFRSATRQSSSYQWVNALTVMKAIQLGEGDEIRTHADIQVRQQEGRLRYPTQTPRPTET